MIRAFVLMGVTSTCNTAVGEELALRLGAHFVDGDVLHSAANVEKMSRGVPLTDEDRWPWLDAVGRVLAEGLVSRSSGVRR